VGGHLRDHRALELRDVVVPAQVARRVLRRVVAVALHRGHVEAADERHVVDDHDLLVVAVQGPLARVELAADRAALQERLLRGGGTFPRRLEERHGRAGPQQHAHRHPFRGGRQQLAQLGRARLPRQLEVGRRVPVRYVDVLLRALDRLRHDRERGGAVDQHLDVVAVLHRPARGEPPRAVAFQNLAPPQPPQSSRVVGAEQVLQSVAEACVENVE
jgi:hypothetical protein